MVLTQGNHSLHNFNILTTVYCPQPKQDWTCWAYPPLPFVALERLETREIRCKHACNQCCIVSPASRVSTLSDEYAQTRSTSHGAINFVLSTRGEGARLETSYHICTYWNSNEDALWGECIASSGPSRRHAFLLTGSDIWKWMCWYTITSSPFMFSSGPLTPCSSQPKRSKLSFSNNHDRRNITFSNLKAPNARASSFAETSPENRGQKLQHFEWGTKTVQQRTFATKILPNFRVNFLARFASKPLFYWVVPSNCSEKFFRAVRAILWLWGSFLALDWNRYRSVSCVFKVATFRDAKVPSSCSFFPPLSAWLGHTIASRPRSHATAARNCSLMMPNQMNGTKRGRAAPNIMPNSRSIASRTRISPVSLLICNA